MTTKHTEGMTDIEVRWHFENILAALQDILGLAEAHAAKNRSPEAQASIDASITAARAAIAKAERTP